MVSRRRCFRHPGRFMKLNAQRLELVEEHLVQTNVGLFADIFDVAAERDEPLILGEAVLLAGLERVLA